MGPSGPGGPGGPPYGWPSPRGGGWPPLDSPEGPSGPGGLEVLLLVVLVVDVGGRRSLVVLQSGIHPY